MRFVCKLDTLFRTIRVSDENSSVTPAIQNFNNILQLQTFCVHYAPLKATSSTFNPFWHNLIFLMHLLICFELNDPEIKKHYKWTLKRSKLGMVWPFHPHSMSKGVERVTAKSGCTSCTNWTISFEVSGFRTKTRLLHWLLNILITYYNSGLFCIQIHNSNPYHQLSILSDIIYYFRCIYWFVLRAKWPWNWKALQNELWKGWNLVRYHHFTCIACAKTSEGYNKNWMHLV